MDPIGGNTQKDNEVPPPNDIIVPSDSHQDGHVGTSTSTGNTPLPLSHQDIPKIVTTVMAVAFPKAKALPKGQHAASQPVTGEFQ